MYKIYKSISTEEIYIEKFNKKRRSFYVIYIHEGLFNVDKPYYKIKAEAFNFIKNNLAQEITLKKLLNYINSSDNIHSKKIKNKIIRTLKKLLKE